MRSLATAIVTVAALSSLVLVAAEEGSVDVDGQLCTHDGVCSARPVVAKEQLLLQKMTMHGLKDSVTRHTNLGRECVRRNDTNACCDRCADSGGYCSPRSRRCYDRKRKHYYETCCEPEEGAVEETCCNRCSGRPYCSPGSGNCYDWKRKDYYLSCGGLPSAPQCCSDCSGKLGYFSPMSSRCYNSKAKDYYEVCPDTKTVGAKGDCKVGGDKWCAATVPDANFTLKTCPNLTMRVKFLTYNLFWWNLFGQRRGNGGSAGRLIRDAAGDELFDVVGFQECDNPDWIMGDAGMTDDKYGYVRWGSNTLAFKKTRFGKLAHGDGEFVGQDFGRFNYRRGAHWVRLEEKETGKKLFVMNHHGPLPVNTGGICGGEATAYNLMGIIERNSEPGDALVFMGDFNADGGSDTVRTLQGYMHHLMSDWVDNYFANCGGDSVKETTNLGKGGSDHNALMAIVEF
eukprot:TRINITY_DN76624_c0_g1_i1.p1 TRINITY_DN76624_c0_g1~~TRINITY_DN76624_c0_g1_i1.p1  ORF type:complete len:456 (-),score=110.41 TRINITY_DN76624_c0_g1_i1:113-1480(-)